MEDFKKPNWSRSMREKYANEYKTTAVLIKDWSNTDNCEVFLLKYPKDSEGENRARRKFRKCVEICKFSQEQLAEHKEKLDKDGLEGNIYLPPAQRIREAENKFELLTEVLTINNVDFSRPMMEVETI